MRYKKFILLSFIASSILTYSKIDLNMQNKTSDVRNLIVEQIDDLLNYKNDEFEEGDVEIQETNSDDTSLYNKLQNVVFPNNVEIFEESGYSEDVITSTPKINIHKEKSLKRSMSINTTSSTRKKLDSVNNNISGKNNIVRIANTFHGVRYVYGGESRNGIDCSAFVRAVYRKVGVELPRVSRYQAKVGKTVKFKDIQVGDLIFFKTDKRRPGVVSHVGMYVGDGKMIHASSKNKKVITVSLNNGYFMKRLSHVKRIANL